MIKEFTIDEKITDYLLIVLDQLKINNFGVDTNFCCTVKGFQTNNICEMPFMQETLNEILNYLPIKNLKYRWFHMIDYEKHGLQIKHNHETTEDFSYVLYLTDCEQGGNTVFYENDKKISIKPQKNKLIFFESKLLHEGNETIDNKKVAVGALITLFGI
jgi:hypothetical protein